MAASPPLRRLAAAVLVLALPLLASHCSKKSQQIPAVQPLPPDQVEKLQALHNPWPDQKPKPPEQVPEDRLEALGDSALQNRNFENSLINYMQILQEHPERYDLHYKVGVLFLLSGKLEPAQKELALVLVHQPEMLQAHEAMGLVHLQGKNYPLAIDEFQYVLAQDPRRAKTQHLLGVTFLESGRPDRAILALKMAIRDDPRQLSSYIALAQAYLQQKNYPQAVADLRQALALAPQDQKVNQLLGRALAAQKQYPQALEAFMKAGDEAQAYNNIGVYYFMDGRYEESAKCFQRALELRPTFYQEAKTNLQRALEKMQETRKDGS
ncbi:MAG: tetratricopeptide repeat protein [Desulfobaccales bacterium]